MRSLNNLRIIFFGTPEFAVASLEALLDAGANVVAVVTAPDKPAGRGLQMQVTPVKQAANEKNIPVLQPARLKSTEFLDELRHLHADVQVVVAFRMLPEAVWNMPPMGSINVHASLLPQYRGAAPINWAIINGETESGVTTFQLKQEIDTGNLLLQDRIAILPDDNAGSLHDKLMAAGAQLLVRTLQDLAAETIIPFPQAEADALRHAPKIFKADTQINWDQQASAIQNFIRGMSPYPAAFTTINQRSVKVYAAHTLAAAPDATPGTVDSDGKSFLRMAANDGWVYLDEVRQEGKKRMLVADFLRGFRL